MATIFGAFRTDTTMTDAQTTFGGVGTTFEINAYSSITFDDGASATEIAGDNIVNETPNDPTQTFGGDAFAWDYTISVTDGVNTFEIGVFDSDLDGDGSFDFPTAEQGFFLGFVGDVPPLNTTFTITAIVDNGASASVASFVPCFVAGTAILTPDGERRVEALCAGDLVMTLRGDAARIRWAGRRRVSLMELQADDRLRPVRIAAGALGNGLPRRDLLVSRQHRMLLTSPVAQRMFGTPEVLIAANKLTELPDVSVDASGAEVEYVHLLFDRHEVVFAEGAPSESLFTGPEALRALDAAAREEILRLFPEIKDLDYRPEAACFIPSGSKQRKLVSRHLRNAQPVLHDAFW